MTIRVHGGVFNDQVLTGDLRHFKVIGADFSGAISDGAVILADVSYGMDGSNKPIPHYVNNGEAVPGSAAEVIYVVLSTQATIAMMNPDASGLHFALDVNSGWANAGDIQTVIRALSPGGATIGVDAVDVSAVVVIETTYSLVNNYPPDATGQLTNDGAGNISWLRTLPADAVGYLLSDGAGNRSWDSTVWGGTNVKAVRTVDDFPPAVNGVRELTNGQNVTYILTNNVYNFGTDVFTITGGELSIVGSSRYSHKLISASASPMFTSTGASVALEYTYIECPNATALVMTGGSAKALSLNTVTFSNVDRIADLTSVTTILRKTTALKATSGGIRFYGSASQCIIDGFLAISSTSGPAYGYGGALFDFGTSVYGMIHISIACRFASSVGNTIISGLANNGNLTPTGRGIVSNNTFEGGGTYLSGWGVDDVRFIYSDNVGLPRSMSYSLQTMSGNETVTDIITRDVPVKIAGTWVSRHEQHFTNSTDGRATYVGIDPTEVSIFVTASVAPTAGTNTIIGLYIVQDGTPIPYSYESTAATAGSPQPISTFAKIQFTTNTYVELWVVNVDNSTDILVSDAKYVIG